MIKLYKYIMKKIIKTYENFDKSTYKIMNNGLKICFILCLISAYILLTYTINLSSPFIYYMGISLFKISLIFGIEFVICGFIVEGIKKQLI